MAIEPSLFCFILCSDLGTAAPDKATLTLPVLNLIVIAFL
jgi:hypothetical protein